MADSTTGRFKGGLFLAIGLTLLLSIFWDKSVLETVRLGLRVSCIVERNITYKTFGDYELQMDIYRPYETEQAVPAVVYIHGGGWYSGDKTNGVKDDILELVAQGYIVAAINYRLAPRYKFPAQIEDVRSAIRFLRANADKYAIDPSNIGVFGASAGGHLAALAGVTNSYNESNIYDGSPEKADAVQAVVDMYGPTDLALICEKDRTLHMEHVFGTDDPESPVIKEASPVTYVSGDDPPFLILHGDQDNEVLLEQSETLYKRLIAVGVPATLVVVNNAGHGFRSVGQDITPTRREITHLIVNFFDQYLKHQRTDSLGSGNF